MNEVTIPKLFPPPYAILITYISIQGSIVSMVQFRGTHAEHLKKFGKCLLRRDSNLTIGNDHFVLGHIVDAEAVLVALE